MNQQRSITSFSRSLVYRFCPDLNFAEIRHCIRGKGSKAVTRPQIHAVRERIGCFKGLLPEGDMRRVKPGLSEETAAALRAHLLGIESADCSTINQKAAW